MATEAAAADAGAAPKKGGKKLLIIILAVVVLLAAAGGGALFFLKKSAADEEGEAEAAAPGKPKKVAKRDPNAKPVFVPLDAFTVNLADRDNDKFGQVTLSLEVVDAKAGETVKAFMPIIRNNILMVLSHKTSAELLEPEGKKRLSHEILVETARALGIDVPSMPRKAAAAAAAQAPAAPKPKAADADAEEEEEAAASLSPRRLVRMQTEALAASPVKAVHYASFIIQ